MKLYLHHYFCKILCSRSWTLHDLKKYKCNFQNIREQNVIAHKHWNRCIFSEGRKVCIHKYDITRILLTRLWLFHVFWMFMLNMKFFKISTRLAIISLYFISLTLEYINKINYSAKSFQIMDKILFFIYQNIYTTTANSYVTCNIFSWSVGFSRKIF